MARIEDIERRLLNWARWKLGATHSGLGYAAMRWDGGAVGPGRRESVIPTIDCEAEETDRALFSLPSELRATVEIFYLVNRPIKWKSAYLCCAESTIKARLWRAQRLLSVHLADRAKLVREERERAETIVSGASSRIRLTGRDAARRGSAS